MAKLTLVISFVIFLNACSLLNLEERNATWQPISDASYAQLADLDKDGVIQAREECQNTEKGWLVNNWGCPIIEENEKLQELKLYYPYTEVSLEAAEQASLDAFLNNLNSGYQWHLKIKSKLLDNPIFELRAKELIRLLETEHANKVVKIEVQRDNSLSVVRDVIKEGIKIPETVELVIHYKHDSSEIDPKYTDEIRDFVAKFKQENIQSIQIIGHTSLEGKEEYNQNLSHKRAVSLANLLEKKYAISGDYIQTLGFGESAPLSLENTDSAHELNRRIEVNLTALKTVEVQQEVSNDDGRVELFAKAVVAEAAKRWHIYIMEETEVEADQQEFLENSGW